MQIINTNEFNANQKKYFELAEKEPVYVTRENAPTLVINVVNDGDTPSPEELLAIQKGLEDIKNGNTTPIEDINNIWESIL